MNNSIKIFMTGGSGFIGYYFQHCTVIGVEKHSKQSPRLVKIVVVNGMMVDG